MLPPLQVGAPLPHPSVSTRYRQRPILQVQSNVVGCACEWPAEIAALAMMRAGCDSAAFPHCCGPDTLTRGIGVGAS
jgi:hypothetical protein